MQRDKLELFYASAYQALVQWGGRSVLELGAVTASKEARSTGWFTDRGLEVTSVQSDPLAFLPTFSGPIDLLLLNAWDIRHPQYKTLHLQAYELAKRNLHARSLILINDTDVDHGGKGELVVAAAANDGYVILFSGRHTLLAHSQESSSLRASDAWPIAWFQDATIENAVEWQQSGLTWQAQQVYQRILAERPENVRAMHLLGVVHLQRREFEAALIWLRRAAERAPQSAIVANNLGAALQGSGRIAEACEQFERAVSIQPRYVDALGNLGHAWQLLGESQNAERYYRAALECEPGHLSTIDRFAAWLIQTGRRDHALQLLGQAVRRLPQSPTLAADLGDAYLLDQQLEPAARAYRRSLELQDLQPRTHFHLGVALGELEQVQEARQHLARACQLRPDKPAWRLREMLLCPSVMPNEAAIDEYQAELGQRLDQLLEAPPYVVPQDLMNIGFHPPFALSFQGRDHRPLKEKFAAVCRHWIRPLHAQPRPGKPRIGFVVTRGHEGGFLKGTAGIVKGLDVGALTPVILCPESSETILRQGLPDAQVQWEVFPETVAGAVDTIARAGCHVLYHWEIGTDGLNYVLPFYRLAPVQVTSWGTQVTTGMQEIDFYLSSELIEAEGAQQHYTELACASHPPALRRLLEPWIAAAISV